MLKKLLISTAIVAAVFASGSVIYAQADKSMAAKKDTPVYELIEDNLESKTFESKQVISGSAKEGTSFSMSLYWFKADNEKSIVAKKKETNSAAKSGEWLLQNNEEWEVGPSGIFVQPVTLEIGKNKIVLKITDKAGNKAEKVWEIELQEEALVTEHINSYILKGIDKNIESPGQK